jgi:hypothetical protein
MKKIYKKVDEEMNFIIVFEWNTAKKQLDFLMKSDREQLV